MQTPTGFLVRPLLITEIHLFLQVIQPFDDDAEVP
jgi:hypothetical protein